MLNTLKRTPRALPGWAVVLLAIGLTVTWAQDVEDAAVTPTKEEIPQSAVQMKNPVAATEESLERGKLFFSSQCTMCHGHDGKGKGDLVGRLKLEPPDFTDKAMQEAWSDGALFYVLTEGHGRMPGQGDRFKDEVKWDLINYVRSFLQKG